jgi:MoaA/NifB/PqqE/SkfB family radical SAM enzyme
MVFWIKYFSFKKLFNVILNLYEYKIKRTTIKSVPFVMHFDVSNICVLNCPLCPTGRREPQAKGTMKFEEFKKIFDKVKGYLFDVKLFNWGEPFLCEDVFKIVEYCHKNRVGVRFHSNLNYYTDEILENIVKYKIDYLHLSIDGYSQEAYEFYRVNGDIAKVFRGLEKIQELKKNYKSKYPIIHWGYLINNKNRGEVEEASNYARKTGVEIFEAFDISLFTSVKDRYSKENYIKFLSEVKEEKYCDTMPMKGICKYIWIDFVVNPNGSCFCCGIPYEDKDIFGWANDNRSMYEILNSEIFIESRKIFKHKNYKPKCYTPCDKCIWYTKP